MDEGGGSDPCQLRSSQWRRFLEVSPQECRCNFTFSSTVTFFFCAVLYNVRELVIVMTIYNVDCEGLLRCGKSCRLRWINYLRTDLKRGNLSVEEEDLIIKLHGFHGNR